MSVTANEVADCIRFLMSLTYIYDVDDEGFIINATTGERYLHSKGNNDERTFVIYQDKIPQGNHEILNPFSEGIGDKHPSITFFYSQILIGLNHRVGFLLRAALLKALELNGHPTTDPFFEEAIPDCQSIADILTGKLETGKNLTQEIDKKTYEELTNYFKTRDFLTNCLFLGYNRRMEQTELSVPALQDTDKKEFENKVSGFLRKKSVLVLQALLRNILGIKTSADFGIYKKKAGEGEATKLSSWLNVLCAVYRQINPFLEELFSGASIDLEAFQHHLSRMVDYTNNAKFAVISPPKKQVHITPQGMNAAEVRAPVPQPVPVQHHQPQQPQPPVYQPEVQQQPQYYPQPGYPSVPMPSPAQPAGYASPGGSLIPGPYRPDGSQVGALPSSMVQAQSNQYGQPMVAGAPPMGVYPQGAYPSPGYVQPQYPMQPVYPSPYPQTQPVYGQPPMVAGYPGTVPPGFVSGMGPVPGMPYGMR